MKITLSKQEYQTIVRCLTATEIILHGYHQRDEEAIRKVRKKLKRQEVTMSKTRMLSMAMSIPKSDYYRY